MKNILQTSMAVLALGMAAPGFAATPEGVTVNHLGPTNTLVRVNGDAARYIMLPVQESIDDARVNVIVDGRLDQTIYVRLAKSKVDYSVPFDLSQYKGKDVVFDIVSRQGRESVREAVTDACWDNISLSDTIDLSNKEKYRPIYHHTPPYAWMNDPNGMFYKDGVWHLYYQWNPYGSRWQNMTWGHSSSTDLVHWEHHPVAIWPNGLGTVFSGSAAIDRTGSAGYGKDAVLAMYTSCGASQMQSIAVSHDNGATFEVYPANPVLTLETEARDPNMFWNEKEGKWNMVLAHALNKEILIFSSPDMKQWTLESAFGKGLGAQDGVWECPDLFRLTVPGTDISKWVMIVNLNPGGPFGGSGIQYFTGDFDGHTFTVDTDAQGNVPTKWLDFGKDNYALVSWSDAPQNRRVAIGWMSNWQYADQVPTMQYRSANTLPREIGIFQGSDGQIYASSTPSPELEAMRLKPSVKDKSFAVGKNYKNFTLPAANDGICEIVLTLESKEADLTMALSNAAGEKVVMNYEPSTSSFLFDRTQSGVTDFSVDFPAITAAPTFESDGRVSLRLFIDRSSIEVFESNGKFSMTNLVFPTKPYTTLSFRSSGNVRVENLTIYPLRGNTNEK